jgi:rhamnosyl/mannosyltransferase
MKILQLGKAYPPVNLGGIEVAIKLITEGLHK